MGTVNVAGFQRARRLEAERKEAKRLKELDEAVNEYANKPIPGEKDPGGTNTPKDDNKPENKQEKPYTMTDEEIENASIEDVKKLLEHYEVPFAHNTGEKKLREKLANAIK